MTLITRESVYHDALFVKYIAPLLAPGATLGGPVDGQAPGVPTVQKPFNVVSREAIEVSRIPPGLQPVLFMDEAVEEYIDAGAGLVKFKATVYFHVGCTTVAGTSASSVLNPLLDTLEAALTSPDGEAFTLGMGDVIERAQLNGLSVKNLGQNSTDPNARQAVAYVPFEIIFA